MKSLRRQQRDIDKARGRLFRWAMGKREGANGIARTVDRLVADVVRRTGRPDSQVQAALAHEPYVMVTRILAMFIWLTGDENKERSATPLARYIRERAGRESSTGRRWLQQLAESRFEMREVIDVTPAVSILLGPSSKSGASVIVNEPGLANAHVSGLTVFARVLPMPAGTVLADGLLMLERHIVAALPPQANASQVFVAWAVDSLAAEGYLSAEPSPAPSTAADSQTGPQPDHRFGATSSQASTTPPQDAETREKLLARVRKLYAMAQETDASPHEAEIALRRCQSLMAKFGISEKDLETSEFGRQTAHTGKRVPMHIQYLSIAVAKLHGVLFVSGGGEHAHFRGYEIDVVVARLTLDYLSDAVERALKARRRTGDFPPGRMASYDYRLAFANEVCARVNTIVREREAEEKAISPTGTALTIRKREIVERECGQDLVSSTVRGRGAIDDAAVGAGREDGSRVSLDPQVGRSSAPLLLGSD